MDDSEIANLDLEFKHYLEIMRPYLAQLLDQDVIELCKAWIQRLSACKVEEKALRNKYVFTLCYQLARGILQEPFTDCPNDKELSPISDEFDSDTSTNDMYVVLKSDEDSTRIIFNSKQVPISDTDYFSQETDLFNESKNNEDNENLQNHNIQEQLCKQLRFARNHTETNDVFGTYNDRSEEYKCRAANLVMRLREIKTQNIMLQKELEALKQECKIKSTNDSNSNLKVDCCTSTCCHSRDSSSTLISLRNKLQEEEESRKVLCKTIDSLKDKLNRFEDMKRIEIDELKNNHKMEITQIQTFISEENKEGYGKKLDEMKTHYEKLIENIHNKTTDDKQDVIASKDELIAEKDKIINSKDLEITRLKTEIEDQKIHLHEVLNKFFEKPNEAFSIESMRIKAEQLEKRLNKAEKSKTKCAKMYEAKLAYLQREKHLAECSLQLQLVRQRAQVVNEVADESQTELNVALNKLESKYKDIVANMQTTAIQRRMQDQIALESILQAACGIRNEGFTNCSQGTNHSQLSSKTMQNQNRNGNSINQSYDSEISALLHGNKVDNLISGHNKSLADGSMMAGYYLDGERMGELLERVYVPQRDIGDGPMKKS